MAAFGPAAPPDESGALPTRCSAVLAGHEGAVLNVRYNCSGAYALSCGKDRTLRLWSPAKGALIKTYTGHGHEARARLEAAAAACGFRQRMR
jgi:mitogen-activated protein kinase organizer 1